MQSSIENMYTIYDVSNYLWVVSKILIVFIVGLATLIRVIHINQNIKDKKKKFVLSFSWILVSSLGVLCVYGLIKFLIDIEFKISENIFHMIGGLITLGIIIAGIWYVFIHLFKLLRKYEE